MRQIIHPVGVVLLVLAASLTSGCIPVPTTDYRHDSTNSMGNSLRSGQAATTVELLDTDFILLPDFHRFAIAENISKRHASIRVVSKQPIKIQLISVALTDLSSNTTISGDTSEALETRIPWAYHYYPYDDVRYRHYEDRVLIFRHTDDRLTDFGSPEKLQLDVTYRLDDEDALREERFVLEKVHYTNWAFP